jgi:hypothetical protein
MALTASWNRAKADVVLAVSSVRSSVLFEDSVGKQLVVDHYSTLNSAVRLLMRVILKPTFNGNKFSLVRTVLDYSAQAASTYSFASFAAATTAPFTLANGVVVAGDGDLDLDAFYTAAGVAKTNEQRTTKWAVKQAAYRRIDFLMIGDSNQLLGGHGWDEGFQDALSNQFGLYATGWISANNNNGNGTGQGYFYTSLDGGNNNINGQTTGAPSFFADSWALPMGIQQYAYIPPSGVNAFASSNGLILSKSGPWDINGAFKGHYCFGLFATNGGAINGAQFRSEEPPYFGLGAITSFPCAGASDLLAYGVIDIPSGREASTMDRDTSCRWWLPHQATSTGAVFALYNRVEINNRTKGCSVHTMHGVGGQSLRGMAAGFQSTPDATIITCFKEARRLQEAQGLAPIVVVWVNSGLNDRNETLTSVGPNPNATGDSAAAYADNLNALIIRLEAVWISQGWAIEQLFWLVVPSHPVSTPDDPKLINYRDAAYTVASTRNRVEVVNINNLTSQAEMSANNWYLSGVDFSHLSLAGYYNLAGRIVSSLLN